MDPRGVLLEIDGVLYVVMASGIEPTATVDSIADVPALLQDDAGGC